ncbi:MAG: hypothetical protein Q9218_002813 [Villophora microphyllina]
MDESSPRGVTASHSYVKRLACSDAMLDSNAQVTSAFTSSPKIGVMEDSSLGITTANRSSQKSNEIPTVTTEATVSTKPRPKIDIPQWMVEMLCGSDEDEEEEIDNTTTRATTVAQASLECDEARGNHAETGIGIEARTIDTRIPHNTPSREATATTGKRPSSKSLSRKAQKNGSLLHQRTSPDDAKVQKRKAKPQASIKSFTQAEHPFVKQWLAREIPADWSDEKREEEFLVQGRRAGMSHKELSKSQYLKDDKYQSVNAITYQLHKLYRNGVDVTPQTEEHRRRAAANGRPKQQTEEGNMIIEMCREGLSVTEIKASGKIKYGLNTAYAIGRRIKYMQERGIDVFPRSKEAS